MWKHNLLGGGNHFGVYRWLTSVYLSACGRDNSQKVVHEFIGGGAGGRGGSCPPLADKGANGIKYPPFRRLNWLGDWMYENEKH